MKNCASERSTPFLLLFGTASRDESRYIGAVDSGPILKIGELTLGGLEKRERTALIETFNEMRRKNWFTSISQWIFALSSTGLEVSANVSDPIERVPLTEDAIAIATFQLLEQAERNGWELTYRPETWSSEPKLVCAERSITPDAQEMRAMVAAFKRLVLEREWLKPATGRNSVFSVAEPGRKAFDKWRGSEFRMAIDEADVEAAITEILEAAREVDWKLQLYPRTLDGPGSVATLAKRIGKTEKGNIAALEAFSRMLNEFNWIQNEDGIWYRVTATGISALQARRSGKSTAEILQSSSPVPTSVTTYHTNIEATGPSIIQAPGAVARDIQQTNTHLQSISQQSTEIADLLKQLADSLSALDAPPAAKVEPADRIKVTAEQIDLPADQRKPWHIKDQAQGLVRCIDETAKTYENFETLRPIASQLWARILEFLSTLPPPM